MSLNQVWTSALAPKGMAGYHSISLEATVSRKLLFRPRGTGICQYRQAIFPTPKALTSWHPCWEYAAKLQASTHLVTMTRAGPTLCGDDVYSPHVVERFCGACADRLDEMVARCSCPNGQVEVLVQLQVRKSVSCRTAEYRTVLTLISVQPKSKASPSHRYFGDPAQVLVILTICRLRPLADTPRQGP